MNINFELEIRRSGFDWITTVDKFQFQRALHCIAFSHLFVSLQIHVEQVDRPQPNAMKTLEYRPLSRDVRKFFCCEAAGSAYPKPKQSEFEAIPVLVTVHARRACASQSALCAVEVVTYERNSGVTGAIVGQPQASSIC